MACPANRCCSPNWLSPSPLAMFNPELQSELRRIVVQRGAEPAAQRLTDPLNNVAPRHYRMNRQWPWWTPWVVMGVVCTGVYVYLTARLNRITQQVLDSLQTMLQP